MKHCPGSEPLLAKSTPCDRPPITLLQHSEAVRECGLHLFNPAGRWGRNWFRFFGLQESAQIQRFLLNHQVTCLLHDWGKANGDFQAMVRAIGNVQVLRHEHLSVLMIHQPEIWQWLQHAPQLDLELIVAAILAHHLQAAMSEASNQPMFAKPRNGSKLEILWDRPDCTELLSQVGRLAEISEMPPIRKQEVWEASAGRWHNGFVSAIRSHNRLTRDLRSDPSRRAMLHALKAGLIVADAAGSGLVREGEVLDRWLKERVESPAVTSHEIREKIIEPRGRQITARNGKPFSLHPFQDGTASIGDRALLLAACGAGKTIAAWRWAEEVSERQEIGKVLFLYPTRGTATEGFRDYVAWAPETDAELLTGTAGYELAGMQENPSEATVGKQFRAEARERLFALGYWNKRFFSATVDQFLAFLENGYAALCMLPVLADAAIVIDEVHSFDGVMFGNLLAFLKRFHGPVLCMTATLPPSRTRDLLAAGLRLYPDESERTAMPDLERLEGHPRYDLTQVSSREEAYAEALRQFRSGRRVLWVVNTVARCQELADKLEKELGQPVLAYHSRYRLSDRQEVHRQTIAAFAQG